MRESKKPKTKGEKKLVWGLVRCKNGKCKRIHNRDVNSCKNMQEIVRSVIEGKGRPERFCRKENKLIHVKSKTKNDMK